MSRCGFQNLHIAKRTSILDIPCDSTTSEYVHTYMTGFKPSSFNSILNYSYMVNQLRVFLYIAYMVNQLKNDLLTRQT